MDVGDQERENDEAKKYMIFVRKKINTDLDRKPQWIFLEISQIRSVHNVTELLNLDQGRKAPCPL